MKAWFATFAALALGMALLGAPTAAGRAGAAEPDLLVTSLRVSPLRPAVGEPVVVRATLRNRGSDALPRTVPVQLRVGDRVVSSLRVEVPVGAEPTIEMHFRASAPGMRPIVVVADPGDEIHEENEANNRLYREVYFSGRVF